MFEGYFKTMSIEEGRRAFALDCILRLSGSEASKYVMEGREGGMERIIKRTKLLEQYLAGESAE